ncbi:MAG: hypothetical protein K2Q32_08870, partial [Alphaproteobacteria bacterium]|nr:hypothetical protein [Alphaproteobacteria bacterium]
ISRNKGIDAILKSKIEGKIALVRVQRDDETLNQTVQALKKASKNKGQTKLIVIATKPYKNGGLLGDIILVKSVCSQLIQKKSGHHRDLFSVASEVEHGYLS